jgi:hypothetical protein
LRFLTRRAEPQKFSRKATNCVWIRHSIVCGPGLNSQEGPAISQPLTISPDYLTKKRNRKTLQPAFRAEKGPKAGGYTLPPAAVSGPAGPPIAPVLSVSSPPEMSSLRCSTILPCAARRSTSAVTMVRSSSPRNYRSSCPKPQSAPYTFIKPVFGRMDI